MANTITDRAEGVDRSSPAAVMYEWEVVFGADNDAVQFDLRGVDWDKGGVVWTRVHTDVAVTWTIESETFDADTQVTAGWHDHTTTELAALETTRLVGLRFKRTGSSGTKMYIRGPRVPKPIEVTGV